MGIMKEYIQGKKKGGGNYEELLWPGDVVWSLSDITLILSKEWLSEIAFPIRAARAASCNDLKKNGNLSCTAAIRVFGVIDVLLQ